MTVSHTLQGLLPDAWPEVLRTLAGFLCPFKAMQQRQQQEVAAANSDGAAGAKAVASHGANPTTATATTKPAPIVHSTLLGRGLARCVAGLLFSE